MKAEGFGFIGGLLTAITVNWSHIIEQSIETAIITLVGGMFGYIGGLLIKWICAKVINKNKYDNITKRD